MPWKWYSIYSIEPAPTPMANLTEAEIEAAIALLKGSADVHDNDNFSGAAADHVAAVKAKADVGYLVMAYKAAAAGQPADALFFQYSKALSLPAPGSPPTPVWIVSHGLDEATFPANATRPQCRTYIRNQLTPALRQFVRTMGVNYLYSIETSDPDTDPDPLGRRIGRLHSHGRGDWWEREGGVKQFSGTEPYHSHWGGAAQTFWLTKIRYLGPP